MEKLVMRFVKNAEKTKNKIVIPKACIERWGNQFYLEVYEDHIKLVPIKKKGE